MLQKKKLSTSTTRFASIINIYDYKKPYRKVIYRRNVSLLKKRFYRNSSVTATNNWILESSGVVKEFLYNTKPYKAFIKVITIFGNNIVITAVESLNVGNLVFNLLMQFNTKNISYLGSKIYIEQLPFNLVVSYLTNNFNNKQTFAKASGTYVTKLKAKKTVKLVLVELPSKLTILIKKETVCFIGKNTNFFVNKFIEGKWGFGVHRSKVLTVRGVAMNPVDHPNGGRTKTKQPEKSPWGWVAKHKK